MSTQTIFSSGNFWHASDPVFDATVGAFHIGHREITATMADVSATITILAWAIGFDGRSGAAVRYEDIKSILGNVGGDGLTAIHLAGIEGNQFGSMSERNDLLGEAACIWISATSDGDDRRGAVLAALDGTLVQLLTVVPYEKSAPLRSTYLLDAIAVNMEARSSDGFTSVEPNRAQVMDRLPALDDLPHVLQDGAIHTETYRVKM